MKKLLAVLLICLSTVAFAKGGSGGGGGHASSGGGHSSFSSGHSSYSGGGSKSFSSSGYRPSSTYTRTTTTRTYRSSYVGGGMMYGGMGMGYGYSNGLLTGLIIGDLMHPQGTTVYNGGSYSGQALLYPDGRVVNAQGYQVGTYQNGQYNAVDGGFVAQAVPQDAGAQPLPQPVVIQQPNDGQVFFAALGIIFLVFLFALVLAMLFEV
jgi:hypothetical protein